MPLPRKSLFALPEGVIYLDGNSLGPLPRGVAARVERVIGGEWRQDLIRAWNSAGWMDLPRQVGNKIAPLIGAPQGSIATGDTLSIKVYQALTAALPLRPGRTEILSDSGNFPTDLYMAQGLIRTLDRGLTLRVVAPEDVSSSITQNTAAVMLTHVDYRTGRMHDMAAVTRAAQAAGAVMIWDLAHSAGAVPVDITACGAEFAVGCTYKFLNGGPGAPAFIYARPDLVDQIDPALSGWLGHEAPFEMAPDYRPHPSTERLRVGTPPVVQMAMLDAALELWAEQSLDEIRAASLALSEQFITEVEARCPMLRLVSPRDGAQRGSQVSFAFEQGYEAIQALSALGVIGDFRTPDIMRFGITPLYLDATDITQAAQKLEQVMTEELWRDPRYATRQAVT